MATNEVRPASVDAIKDGMAMFGPHAVALIDFLGQSSELAKWDFVPSTIAETAVWVPAVRNTMGRVLQWRKQFETGFQAYSQSLRKYEEQFSQAESRGQLDRFRQTVIAHQHFSDTLIFYSPLYNEHGYLQTSNVAAELFMCGALLLAALNAKTVFRGAIGIGLLSRFPTGDPYGPALAKVHHLESKVADYPRVIVGPGLLAYLDATIKSSDKTGPAQANQAVAAECYRHIARDTDGCYIVDYLNDTFANTGGNAVDWRKMQADGFAFVQSELARFSSSGDSKLEKRYQRLQAYFVLRGSRAEKASSADGST